MRKQRINRKGKDYERINIIEDVYKRQLLVRMAKKSNLL